MRQEDDAASMTLTPATGKAARPIPSDGHCRKPQCDWEQGEVVLAQQPKTNDEAKKGIAACRRLPGAGNKQAGAAMAVASTVWSNASLPGDRGNERETEQCNQAAAPVEFQLLSRTQQGRKQQVSNTTLIVSRAARWGPVSAKTAATIQV
jgi:hypothetical protein